MNELKKLRQERKLTQAQFAEWLEIPKRTYEKWETGERTPPQWVISLIQFKCEKSTRGEQLEIEEVIACCKNCKNANILSENLIECCLYGLRSPNSICQSGMYIFQQKGK